MKIPSHQFVPTVSFYRDILGLEQIELDPPDQLESVTFKFGDINLWLDKTASLSQAEIWLEIQTDNVELAKRYFDSHNIARRDDIEPLPQNFNGFWISNPSDIIHLIN